MSLTRGQCDARPTVTFPAARYHRPLAGTKLYCLVTEVRVALDSGEARIRTRDLFIASPASQPLGHRATQGEDKPMLAQARWVPYHFSHRRGKCGIDTVPGSQTIYVCLSALCD